MPLPQPTSLRDRTSEFLVTCERLQKLQQGTTGSNAQHAHAAGLANGLGPSSSQSGAQSVMSMPSTSTSLGPASSSATNPRTQIQQHSEFAKRAAEIGHSIQRTSVKLQKLTQLAKRTSMFDDPAAEVSELTYIIKQDIQLLNTSLVDLQRLSAKGTNENNKQSQDHSHTVVDSLRTRLKDATQEFKDVLTARTDSLKHHKERRQLFSSGPGTDAEVARPLLRPQLQSSASDSSSSQAPFQQNQQPAPIPSFLQQQQQQLTLSAPQDTYLSSRAEALRNVESTIVELGGIFNKLSEMVSQQGEMAIRIDENIDDTLSNVTSAQAQLLKYLNTISSNRWLVLKVFGVMLFFLIFFIVFIA